MHISEGVLSGNVLIAGGALAAAGTAIGLKKLDYEQIAVDDRGYTFRKRDRDPQQEHEGCRQPDGSD